MLTSFTRRSGDGKYANLTIPAAQTGNHHASIELRVFRNRFVETRTSTAELQATVSDCCFLLHVLNEAPTLVSLN